MIHNFSMFFEKQRMIYRCFCFLFLIQILSAKKNIPNAKHIQKFPIIDRQLFFTIDPRPHNDEALMKKIISDNEKIHLLKKLTSNTSTLHKLELIERKISPIHINPDDLLKDWNFDDN